jgi:hypothetical protein
MYQVATDVCIKRWDGGAAGLSAAIVVAAGTTYYVTLERNTAILATLSVYSDAGRTAHIAGSPVTLAIPATVTGLRYLQATNYNDNDGAAKEIIGWIDDVLLDNYATFNVPVSSTAHIIEIGQNNTLVPVYLDSYVADGWTDVTNQKISVDVINKWLAIESERSADDTRSYKDLTRTSDVSWQLDFTYKPTTITANSFFGFGLFSNLANLNGYANDVIFMYQSGTNLSLRERDGGVLAVSAGLIPVVAGTTYYVTLERNSAILATLSVYSDAARTTHIAGSPQTLAIPTTVTALRYIQGSNVNDGAGAAFEVIGWIDDLTVKNVYIPYISVDGTVYPNFTNRSVIVPNSSSNWTVMSAAVSYLDYYYHYVAGVRVGRYEPIVMLNDTTLPDRATGDGVQNGTIHWGSNNGVEVSFGAMVSSESTSYSAESANATGFVMPTAPMPAQWFATGSSLVNLPFYFAFLSVATDLGMPVQTLYLILAIGLASGVGLWVIARTKAMLIGVLAMALILFFASQMTIVPMWMMFTYLIAVLGMMFLYRQMAY